MRETVEQLVWAMQEELQGQRKLAAVLGDKLDAMRRYDTTKLTSLADGERQLMDGTRAKAVKRGYAVEALAAELFPQRSGGRVTARELASAVGEPAQSRISSLAGQLGEAAEATQRLNRINVAASRKVLDHMDHVFRVIAQSGRDIGLYGRMGKQTALEQNRLIDAIA